MLLNLRDLDSVHLMHQSRDLSLSQSHVTAVTSSQLASSSSSSPSPQSSSLSPHSSDPSTPSGGSAGSSALPDLLPPLESFASEESESVGPSSLDSSEGYSLDVPVHARELGVANANELVAKVSAPVDADGIKALCLALH